MAEAHTHDDGGDPALAETAAGELPSGSVPQLERDRVKAIVRGSLFGRADAPVRIGRFDVLRKLGSGGMGVVYSAYDDELDRKVAIKLLRADRAAAKGRLRREAQAIARLSHPNVAVVYEVGEHRDQLFIAMEFVRGATLRQWLQEQARSWREVRDVFVQAGQGLAAAHAAGLVHRDFKPDNVMVGADGRVRVLDFGLAALVGASRRGAPGRAPEGPALGSSESAPVESLTLTGAVLGTPAYMAPEQLVSEAADPRSDQFSFCVSLWQAWFGSRPFAGDTVEALRESVTRGPAPSVPSHATAPAQLCRAVLRGLSVDPDARFADMPALLHALRFDPAARRRRVALVAVAVALAAGASTGGYVLASEGEGGCEAAQTELAAVWDGRRRTLARDALAGAEEPLSLDVWARTADALDARAQEWAQVHARTCEAEALDEDVRLERRLCLQSQLEGLKVLTDGLVAGEPPDPQEIERLPTASQCETEEHLRRHAQARAVPASAHRGLLSDFDDGTEVAGGSGWTPSVDSLLGGNSEVALERVFPGRGGDGAALRLRGIVGDKGPARWAGTMMFPGSGPFAPVNLEQQDAITFWVRGTPGMGVVMLFSVRNGFQPAIVTFSVGDEWSSVRVDLDELDESRYDVTGIFFGAATTGPFDLVLDDVGFDAPG